MRLAELLKGIRVLGGGKNLLTDVKGIFSDSRKKVFNGAFVAIKGEKRNGNEYIQEAISNGAVVIITDDENTYEKEKNAVLVESSRRALSYMWDNFYNHPTENINLVAITGTNGKTSCAYYLYNILRTSGKDVGLISTIECLINGERIELNGGSEVLDICSAMTTPDPEILYSLLDEMRAKGVKYIVMEASSHALEQEKLSPLSADYAIFTNLSAEHLDFHKTLEAYYQAKKRLFKEKTISIVNVDDSYGERLKNELDNVKACSLKKKADFYAENIELLSRGYRYKIKDNNKYNVIDGQINGEFSVYNSLLSLACARSMGIEMQCIVTAISTLNGVEGRFEKIDDSNIYVDYAHTPYAVENVLKELKKITPEGRVFALFGCGGDRDRSKRAKMGEIATLLADVCIITSDNSRSERTLDIIVDIMKGIRDKCELAIIPDREKAILYAISQLRKKDSLILLGKGHECYQIDNQGKHYFNEREIVRRALKHDKNEAL